MLMRTDPFRELDRVAQQVFGTNARPAAMPIDAYRKGDEFVVLFDLPGCRADSINLTVERNVLTVHAERIRPSDDDVELLIGERPNGTFSRQLFLAETLDTERIGADYTDGVLRLRVPVKEQAKPRRVSINAGESRTTPIETTTADGDRDTASSGVAARRVRDRRERGGERRAGARCRSPTPPPRSTRSGRSPTCSACRPPSCAAWTPSAS